MPIKHFTALLSLFLFSTLTVFSQTPSGTPVFNAFRTGSPPVIDGCLDDPCWQNAEPVTDFTQRQPHMGDPATFPIAVRIAYDSDHIYLAFEIHCGDPDKLISTVLQRDGAVNGYDDHFGFRLDTFHNHRDLYYFYINPKGTRLDGHASDEGVVSDNNWDGVWEVKTRLLPDGWCGEVSLPLYNFRFRENEDGVWGFACLTYVTATQENVMWPYMEKNSRKPSLFGHIAGLHGLNRERPLLLLPSVSQGSRFGRQERDTAASGGWKDVKDEWESNLGLDLRYRPASAVETNLALNPDFASVEADEFVFNLSLDEFQYPEKRPFFTEGQDRFETPIQLLYTRRMGLGEDEMLGGGKLHGQVGKWSFGALDVLTGESFGDPSDNYSALRLKRDILRSSTIGFLAVSKDAFSNGLENRNAALGADFNYQVGINSRIVAQLAGSSRPGSGGNGYAGALSYQFGGKVFTAQDNLSIGFTAEDITPDFDIREIGYIGSTRLDRRGFRENLGYDYWIKSHGINRVSASQSGWMYQDHGGNRRVQDGWSGQFSIESRNLIRPGLLLERSFVLLPSSGKNYDNSQRTLSVQFGPYPRFLGTLSWRTGDNYGNDIRYAEADLRFKPLDRMTVTANLARLDSRPLGGSSDWSANTMANLGVLFLFTPNLYWRLIVQGDSSSEIYLANNFLRWEFRPGSTFYLSYREIRDDHTGGFVTTDRQVSAKVAYLIKP
ncbi:MAG: carbohydrate binding family 9 domain-containing protein [Candidatus Latescibacterota bacterium]